MPGLEHTTIPPSAHTWQADVETAYRLIEDEFYEVERFSGRQNFLQKAASYNLWFNVARKNSYKGHRPPGKSHTRETRTSTLSCPHYRLFTSTKCFIKTCETLLHGDTMLFPIPFETDPEIGADIQVFENTDSDRDGNPILAPGRILR